MALLSELSELREIEEQNFLETGFNISSSFGFGNDFHINIIGEIFINFNISAIKIILNNKAYKNNMHSLYKYNNHLYERNVYNYNHIHDINIESTVNDTISQNNNLIHNLVLEKHIINIINSYENDLIFNEMIDLLNKQVMNKYISTNVNDTKSIENFFYEDSEQIYSNCFMKFYFENYIFKQKKEIQTKFFIDFFIKKLDIELCDYLAYTKEFRMLCTSSDELLLLFLKFNSLIYIEILIDIIDFNVIKELELNEYVLELFINKGINNYFWIYVNTYQLFYISETFVIKYNKFIDIKLFSQKHFLSAQFLKLYENLIDWNSLLSNNKYDKETLKPFQYHLIYYLYSNKLNEIL